jgi:hypothetical protein
MLLLVQCSALRLKPSRQYVPWKKGAAYIYLLLLLGDNVTLSMTITCIKVKNRAIKATFINTYNPQNCKTNQGKKKHNTNAVL